MKIPNKIDIDDYTTADMVCAIIGMIVGIIIVPVIYFFAGWCIGAIAKAFIGIALVQGLNYLFGTNTFDVSMLPLMFGAISTVGYVFNLSK